MPTAAEAAAMMIETSISYRKLASTFLHGLLTELTAILDTCDKAIISDTLNLTDTAECLKVSSLLLVKLVGVLLILSTILMIPVALFYFVLSTIIGKDKKFNSIGSHVVVTGGSSGIGLAVAEEYLRNGSNVTIIARDERKLKTALKALEIICDEVKKNNKNHVNVSVMSVSVDVCSNVSNISKCLDKCIKKFGPVDVLINCAGTSVAGEFDVLPEEEFEHMLRVNVLGSVYPTRAIIDGMKKTNKGRIVFVASQVAQAAIYGYTAYAASKWALRGLAEALQMEVKPYNIYVSVAYPPDTDTPGYQTEMLTKPALTKKLSESGSVFNASVVAKDIFTMSNKGYFGISTGLDGWLLKQLHPGMSPLNSSSEVLQQIVVSPIARIISVFIIFFWDRECLLHKK